MKIEEDEYKDLSDTYNTAKAAYDRAYSTAIEKIKAFKKESIKHIPYKQSICKMICDLTNTKGSNAEPSFLFPFSSNS